MNYRLTTHPILDIPARDEIPFYWNKNLFKAQRGETISSALYANGVSIFGHHHRDGTAQGIYCANGQCARCMVIADGLPVKSCMTAVRENMQIESADGLPTLPIAAMSPSPVQTRQASSLLHTFHTDVLIIGGGPSGLSAAIELQKHNIDFILIDDKNELGGKLVLQTHKFFGSVEDSYAGTRGIDIGKKLAEAITPPVRSGDVPIATTPPVRSGDVPIATTPPVQAGGTPRSAPPVQAGGDIGGGIWLNSTALYVFKDKKVGILRDGEYVLVQPKIILNAAGAREKFLRFAGNHLAGIYGAGAFQTLVNRDLIKSSQKLFIIGGGNVGLIAGYHALQAGIEVVGLVEAMPSCGGYKVHCDKLRRLGVPIYTSHTILSANSDLPPSVMGGGGGVVQSITIAQIDKDFRPIAGTEQTFACDTILIAVGLDSLSEFTYQAEIAGIKVFAAGDAHQIAEASSAMFNGKIAGLVIAKELGANVSDIPAEWYEKAEILQSHPGKLLPYQEDTPTEGIVPIIHCLQEIPCNPCTTVCPTNSIQIKDGSLMGQPRYEGSCIGCGKCLLICPGLAISLVDYRKDPENPIVSLPYEVSNHPIAEGDEIEIVDIDAVSLGKFKVAAVVSNKLYKTQQIKIQMPKETAKKAIGIKIQKLQDAKHQTPELPTTPIIEEGQGGSIPLEKGVTSVCLCERVSEDELRKYIRQGITDINQLKALTRLGMGACGSKTCDVLIKQIMRQEGVNPDDITEHTRRPVFIEVPLEKFASPPSTPITPHIPPCKGGQSGGGGSSDDVPIAKTPPLPPLTEGGSYDVVIIGAGSVGVPTAMSIAQSGRKVLCIDSLASPGQANNKKAIGGVRATHSDFGKIKVCQRSIEIFSTWQELHGDDLGWMSNGYSFPAFDEQTEQNLKELLKIQQSFGLNISWLSAEEYQKLVPGIAPHPLPPQNHPYPPLQRGAGLRGATYSPQDGSCSPLLACNAFYFKSLSFGAEYKFKENVVDIKHDGSSFTIKTDKGQYCSKYLINCSGNSATAISKMLGIDCPVTPDSHEAGITDPVQRFMGPMVVDIRGIAPSELAKGGVGGGGSKNYYFYQNNEGQVIFCITPDPLQTGTDSDATSEFLPLCVARMLSIYPALRHLKVRRQWRGQYPMTPDGFPIVGAMPQNPHFIQAVGMCGQGFMLGPGLGELICRIVNNTLSDDDLRILKHFAPDRTFTGMEMFK